MADLNTIELVSANVISLVSNHVINLSGVAVDTGGGWIPESERRKLKKLRSELVRKEQEKREQAKHDKQDEKRELERIFNRINGIEEVSAELESIVEPFAKEVPETASELQPQMPQIDFGALAMQTEIADRLRRLATRIEKQNRLDEEDAIALLLLV